MRTNYKKYAQYGIIAMIALFTTISTVSAQVNTLYYMKTVSTRHELNPSFQPIPKGYYTILPIISGFSLGLGNNSVAIEDLIYPVNINGENKTFWFYDKDHSHVDDFYKSLKSNTNVYYEADLRLFAFGVRLPHNSYLTIGLNTKINAGFFIPKDLAKLSAYGVDAPTGTSSFDLSGLGARANVYSELAAGYSREINKKLTVGGKLKLLLGHANTTLEFDKFKVDVSKDRLTFDIKSTINMSAPNIEYELDEDDKIEDLNTSDMLDKLSFGKLMGGTGIAVDLGANYKLLDDKLTLSASLLDLGFIKWKAQNAANAPIKGSFVFEGVDITIEDGVADWDDGYFDNILEDNIDYTTTFNSYTSFLAAKVLIGAEYGILNNILTFGGLSKSSIVNKTVFQEITASVNYLQFSCFNASLSYSLLNGRFGTIGLGLGGRLGPINIYAAGDYFPAHYTKQFIPYKNKAFNFQMGILFNFGYKKPPKPKTSVEQPLLIEEPTIEEPIIEEPIIEEAIIEEATKLVTLNVKDSKGTGITQVNIEVKNLNRDENASSLLSYDDNGNPVLSLRTNNTYELDVTKKGYTYFNATLDVKTTDRETKDIVLDLLTVETKMVFNNITFETNSAELNTESYAELNRLLSFMERNPELKIEIAAHTDDTGSNKYNLRLSDKRAESVVKFLVSNKISKSRVRSKGYGALQPLVPNDSDENRAKNRRVEIKMINEN
ncbi:MAG: DUF5723 family protein [Prevotellaceae bacterium]|nr:DUF5723 family protein [Prevotellaceae bacterium]